LVTYSTKIKPDLFQRQARASSGLIIIIKGTDKFRKYQLLQKEEITRFRAGSGDGNARRLNF